MSKVRPCSFFFAHSGSILSYFSYFCLSNKVFCARSDLAQKLNFVYDLIMQRKFDFSIGEFYHIYNRGNNKSTIFTTAADYGRFMFLLFVANSRDPVRMDSLVRKCRAQGRTLRSVMKEIERGETLVDIGVYCLMPNHFHILIHEKYENGVSLFMQKLLTGYSMYFNKKYERTGSLFEGKFKAEHAGKDEYLKYLFAYIHLNPVKLIEPNWREVGVADMARVKKYLKEYKYSSYVDYLGEDREEKLILNKEAFPGYFEEFKDFEDFIDEWINYNKENSLF